MSFYCACSEILVGSNKSHSKVFFWNICNPATSEVQQKGPEWQRWQNPQADSLVKKHKDCSVHLRTNNWKSHWQGDTICVWHLSLTLSKEKTGDKRSSQTGGGENVLQANTGEGQTIRVRRIRGRQNKTGNANTKKNSHQRLCYRESSCRTRFII